MMTSGKSLCTSVSTADKSRWMCKCNPGFVLQVASGVSWMNWLSARWSPCSRPPSSLCPFPSILRAAAISFLETSPSLSCLKPSPCWLLSTAVTLHPTFQLEYISQGFLKQQCPSVSLYQTSPFACKCSLLTTILQTLKLLPLLRGCEPSWEAPNSGRQVLTLPTPTPPPALPPISFLPLTRHKLSLPSCFSSSYPSFHLNQAFVSTEWMNCISGMQYTDMLLNLIRGTASDEPHFRWQL